MRHRSPEWDVTFEIQKGCSHGCGGCCGGCIRRSRLGDRLQGSLARLPLDTGGLVVAFAFDPRAADTVYAATLGGRVYKTTDGGSRWQSTTTGPISTRVDALVADPRRPETLYAGTGVAVFKTVNGGRSWRGWNRGLLPPPPVIAPNQVTGTPGWRRAEGWVTALAVDPTDSDIVYAGTGGGGVKKSTDGGHSWRTVLWRGRYMGISALVIAPTSPQVVYAAAFIDEPADCGLTRTGGEGPPCRESALLYKSADGGKTWRSTGLGRVSNPTSFFVLAVDRRRPNTLYAARGRTIFSSTNAGHNWRSNQISGLPRKAYVNSLAVDPGRSGTVYAGFYAFGIFKTTNGGRTWSRASSGFPVNALAGDPARRATIYAAVDNRKYRIAKEHRRRPNLGHLG